MKEYSSLRRSATGVHETALDMRTLARLIGGLIVGAMVSSGCATKAPPAPSDKLGFFCSTMKNAYSNVAWKGLRAGERLDLFDAVLTCRASGVVLRSSRPVGTGVDWVGTDREFVGSMGADSLIALISLEAKDPPSGVTIEAIAVSGVAYYTKDHDAIRDNRILKAKRMGVAEYERIRSAEEQELASLRWQRVSEGQALGPWNMIWTRQGGRVEVEVLEPPSAYTIAPWSGVVDQAGQRTEINRLMSNVHFIMKPAEFLRARVNKVIGDVMYTTDEEGVRAFFSRYGRWVRYSGDFDRNAYRSWLKMLRRPSLE